MEMDNKTWLINEIVTSDMDAKAKAELVLMIKPLEESKLEVKAGDILKHVHDGNPEVYTVVAIREVYGGKNQAVIYCHLNYSFYIYDEDYYANPKYFKIVGHHEGGRMTWADG